MSTKLRVGVIGCGGISSNHIRGYIDSGRYEIVGLSDLDESGNGSAAAGFHPRPVSCGSLEVGAT